MFYLYTLIPAVPLRPHQSPYVGLVLILLIILKLDSTSLPLFPKCLPLAYIVICKCARVSERRSELESVDSLIASLNNCGGLGRTSAGGQLHGESPVVYRRFAVPLLRAFHRSRTRAHAPVGAYENRGETERRKKKKKHSIVIHPHCIIYGVSLLSPSAGVRPRDPYSGDLTSRD